MNRLWVLPRLVLPLILSAHFAPAKGAETEPQVAVSVDRPRPSAGDTVRLTYTFSGPGTGGSLRAPASLPLKNLTLVGGPSSSTRITFINGELERSLALTYYVRPLGQGPAEVGETTWVLGDKSVKAAGTVLEVGPARQGVPGPGIADEEQPSEDPFDAFFRPRARRAPVAANAPGRRAAIIEFVATPDRTSAYVGEEIAIHYELVTQADIEGLEFVEAPKYPGCWAEDLEKPEKPVGRRDALDGRPVTRFTLLRKAVSGLAPGTLELPSAKVRLAVRSAGDPFSDPFGFMQRQVIERATKPITLKILAIPGRKDFKGPVGSFELTARLDRAHVPAGEAVTLKVRIAGTGNLRTASDPPRVSIPNARLYAPTRISDAARATGKQSVSAEWDYVLVPAARGELTIPPISMDVFDPSARKILTKHSAPIVLAVDAAASEPAASSVAQGPASDVPTVPASSSAWDASGTATTVLPTNPSPELRAGDDSGKKPLTAAVERPESKLDLKRGTVTLPLWILAALPGAILVIAGAAFANRRRLRRDQGDSALRPEPEETKERAAARIDRALRDLLSRRFAVPDGASGSQISDTLSSAGVPAERIAEVRALVDDLEFLRFAPQLGEYGERIRQARERASTLFRRIG